MDSIAVFLVLSAFCISSAQKIQSNVIRGSYLTPGINSTWLSLSGLFAFGFYMQGNGYAVVPSNATLHFASDGKLLIADSVGSTSAAMLDSGNFVLYNSDREALWQSFDLSERTTQRESFFLQCNGMETLFINLWVLGTTITAKHAYYASATSRMGKNVTLNLSADGHLYLLDDNGSNIKNLTETIYLMRIDADGIFRLYSYELKQNGNWSDVWSSSNDLCDPKGLCGLNGYCVLNDNKAECKCLPGFEMVHQGNWTAGCEKSFNAAGCNSKDEYNPYTMRELANTVWEDMPYSVFVISTQRSLQNSLLGGLIAFIKVGKSTPADMPKDNQKGFRLEILIIGAVFLTFGGMMLVISGIVFYKNHFCDDVAPRSFTYLELEKATDGFREEVGRGSFGTVYKGAILNGLKIVAVKKLERVLAEGEREFQTEMKVIGRMHQRNLVRLLGYCHDGPHRLLVYEYMSNGSLADILFPPKKQTCWEERTGIARDIARGILYLHEECERQIIHCDIKPQNILVDDYGSAKICDFGLAKLLKPDQTRIFTGIRGTKGYVAPEWHRKLPITVKADVYSYGIVLLEIISRRKSVDWSLPEDIAVLEDWAYHCFEASDLDKLVGPDDEASDLDKLVGPDDEVDKKQLERMVKLGLWCIQDEPSLRPSMKKVLLMLEGTVDIPTPPSPTSFFSVI
ncbi:hypothetical protein I3842_03G121900 [Carya illinoinensis]|uniref:non-specific serine/threonine protein kinase n=1 Tax=Carya illinoinensis TaxID=32201 RepID=A0A922JV76_CARIL|nr:hypothetical protein I3842_03G121900 [Carya illinoinensis]